MMRIGSLIAVGLTAAALLSACSEPSSGYYGNSGTAVTAAGTTPEGRPIPSCGDVVVSSLTCRANHPGH